MIAQQVRNKQGLLSERFSRTGATVIRRLSAFHNSGFAGFVFDVDGTLYDGTCWWRWIGQLVAHWGVRWPFDSFYEGWSEEFAEEVCCGRLEFWESLHSYLLGLDLPPGLCDEILVASRAKHRLLEHGLHPFVGVRETLAKLNAYGVHLVAACNAPSSAEQARERLSGMGLGVHFSIILASHDLGCMMASPRFFDAVLDESGLAAEEMAFVSIRRAHLNSARTAGLAAITFAGEPDFEPDIALDRFAGLLDLPRTSSSRRKAS
jgi:FMN phosphatase YigB (HAD superfamily)